MPYEVIKPILAKIKNPEQLRQIELSSPQIIGETVELWQRFIQRDVENWREKNYYPSNAVDWPAVYKRYMDEQKAKIDYDKEKLRLALAGIKQEQTSNLSKKVKSQSMPKPPKDPRMLANDGGVPISVRSRSANRIGAPGRRSTPISYIGPAATGVKKRVNIVQKARHEAALAIAARRPGKANVPDFRSQIKKAPAGMVNEYRKAAEEEKRKLSPIPRIPQTASGISPRNSAMDEREARLRAIKVSGAKKLPMAQEPYLAPPQVLDFYTPYSEDAAANSGNDDDDIEKLFGEYHERQLSAAAKRKLHGSDYADTHIHRPSPVKPATKRTTDIPPEEWEAKMAKRKSPSPQARSRPESPGRIIGQPKNESPTLNLPKRVMKRPPPADPFMRPKKLRRP
jgi:elongin-A